MGKADPERLAAALRENLKKRKERMRIAHSEGAPPVVESGADEEGDMAMPGDGDRAGGWIAIDPSKPN